MLSKDSILKSAQLFQVYYKTGHKLPEGIKCYTEYTADKDTVYPVKKSYLGTLRYSDLKGQSHLKVSLRKAFKNKDSYIESFICHNHWAPTDDPDTSIRFPGFEKKTAQILYVYDEPLGISESERKAKALKRKHHKSSVPSFNSFLKNTPVSPELLNTKFARIECRLERFSSADIKHEGMQLQLKHPELFPRLYFQTEHISATVAGAPLDPWIYEDGIRTDIPYLDFSSVYYYQVWSTVRADINTHLMQYLDFKRNHFKHKPSEMAQEFVTVLFTHACGLMFANIASGNWPKEACCAAGLLICLKEILDRSNAMDDVRYSYSEMNHVLIKFNGALEGFDSKLRTGKISMIFSNYLAPYTHVYKTLYPKVDEGPEEAFYYVNGQKFPVKNHNRYKYSEAYKEFRKEFKTKSVHTDEYISKRNEKIARAVEMVTVKGMSYSAVCAAMHISKPTLIKMLRQHASEVSQETAKESVDLLSYKTYEDDDMLQRDQHQLLEIFINGVKLGRDEVIKASEKASGSPAVAAYVKSKGLKLKKNMSVVEEHTLYESCKGAIDNVFSIIDQYLDRPFILQGI